MFVFLGVGDKQDVLDGLWILLLNHNVNLLFCGGAMEFKFFSFYFIFYF